jgi:glycosyltransferase involved in cell wall biosynthesis
MRICTIVARNYLAYARVLAGSFFTHHPTGECFVLVIDDVAGEVDDTTEPFEVVRPQDLAIERLEGMAAMYDVTELATAVKPWLLEYLLDSGDGAPIAYFDPDIRFYAPADEIERLAVDHELVLTPHITAPIPEDGKQPGELDLMASGTYNLGFVAMAQSPRTQELLRWWQKRLHYDCVIDHALGYFVDQRWFDLVPNTFAGTAVLRDPGMNMAYWNLHERTLSRDAEGNWLANGQPLRFFHFSGFDVDNPHLLSKHQTRTRLSEHPELAELCAEFAAEVRGQRRPGASAPYAWGTLGDGRPWDRRLRRLYREGEREGAFRLSPFDPDGAQEFLAWLNEPALDAATPTPVSRFWFDVYRERSDLQAVFPNLPEEVDAFLRWIDGYGHEMGDVRGLVPDEEGTASALEQAGIVSGRPAEQEPWGVNLAGFLQSELGIGEAARGVVSGLDAVNVPVLPVHGAWRPSSRQDHSYTMFDTDAAAFPVNLVCVNADVLPLWAAQAGESFFAGRYTIGFWWWEVLRFPDEWLPAFDLVDEVWVATQHVADALSPVSPVPVTKVTLPVAPPPVTQRSRRQLGLPDGFLFLYLFDYHSVFERKNPLAAIEAFKRAFPPGSGPKLAIKCINHTYHEHEHEALLLAASEHPDVYVVDRYVSASEKNSMIASADCYVSLHRAEGFGLTPAESLCMGKPVIATRYGGNLDFMNDRNSWLVDYRLVPVGPGKSPYPADGEWAEPDVDQAATYMRAVAGDSAATRKRAEQGARDMLAQHSPKTAGLSMKRRLDHIRSRRDQWPRRVSRERTSQELDRASELVAWGEQPQAPSLGRARRLIRRATLRLMKPHTVYAGMVDAALLEAVKTLAEDVSATEDALRADRLREAQRTAAQLAELRRLAARLDHLGDETAAARTQLGDEKTPAPTQLSQSLRTPERSDRESEDSAFVHDAPSGA